MPRLQPTIKYTITLILMLVVLTSIAASEASAGNFYRTQWQTYDPIVRVVANRYRLDPRLVHAVVWQESNYNSRAVSSAGAQGLMQLMPGTARELGVQRPFSKQDNIDGGTRYLITQIRRFGSVKKALQAYHCGPARVASGRVPGISYRYANQVVARYRHIKRIYPLQ